MTSSTDSADVHRERRLGSMALGLALSAVILVILLRQLDWNAFVREFKGLDLRFAPLIVVLYLFSFWLRAMRWRLLLPSDKRFATMKLVNACLVGMLATCLLPLRAGEFVRPWAISKWQDVSFPRAFASVVTERVFDVIAMLALLGLFLGHLESAPPLVSVGAQALGGVAAAIIAVMLAAYFRADLVLSLLEKVLSPLARRKPALASKLSELAGEFIDGLRAISSFRQLALVLLWSFAMWIEFAILYQAGLWLFRSFPSLWVGIGVNVLVALAIAVPSAPGFVGTFQLGCVAALGITAGFSREFAIAYSVVLHSLQLLLSIVFGFVALHAEGLTFGEIAGRKR